MTTLPTSDIIEATGFKKKAVPTCSVINKFGGGYLTLNIRIPQRLTTYDCLFRSKSQNMVLKAIIVSKFVIVSAYAFCIPVHCYNGLERD